jgi:hypothetical protein
MILNFKSKNRYKVKAARCTICNSRAFGSDIAYVSEVYNATVCSECCKRFSRSEIKLMIGLFFAYGGFFGKIEPNGKTLEEICLLSLKKLKQQGKNPRLEEINIRIYHQLLLHGYNQDDYIEYLNT